jgi:hypothetical protein
MMGPGKYDEFADVLAHSLQADGLVLIVVGGLMGAGMCVKCRDEKLVAKLPAILRDVADLMEKTGTVKTDVQQIKGMRNS